MDMILHDFNFQNFDSDRLANLPHHLFRSFPDFFALEDLLPLHRTAYQMVTRVVDQMIRLSQFHASCIPHYRTRDYAYKWGFLDPLISPSAGHAIPPQWKATRQPAKVSCKRSCWNRHSYTGNISKFWFNSTKNLFFSSSLSGFAQTTKWDESECIIAAHPHL